MLETSSYYTNSSKSGFVRVYFNTNQNPWAKNGLKNEFVFNPNRQSCYEYI